MTRRTGVCMPTRCLGALIAACLALGATTLSCVGLKAETSAWQQRVAPGTRAAPKTAPAAPAPPTPKAKVKSQAVEPGKAPAAPLPGSAPASPPARPSLGPTTVPNESVHTKTTTPSTDPAYEAFDQGKYLTALDLAQKAAAAGEPQAHTLIARIHAEGLGVPKDPATAAGWYAKGAELGDIEAAFGLGVLHAQGVGVKKDLEAAARLFETAALKGHPLANYNLALLFLRGEGKAENPRRAYLHMRYAAERGVVSAQYDLGTMITTGIGTEANAFEGAKWIGKAARAGHVEAEVEYAVILFRVDADPRSKEEVEQQRAAQKEAIALLRSATDKGNPVAQNRLGRCYAHGLGVEMNVVEAAKWHLIARGSGVEDDVLDGLLAKLSRADRQKAEAAAIAWRERAQVQ